MGLLGLDDDEAMLMAASLLSGKGNAMANMGGGLLGVHGYRQGETERSLNNIRLTQAKQGLADDTQARQILMGGQGEAVPYGKGAAVSNVPSMGGGMPNMGGPGNVNPGQSGGKMATFNKYNAIADQFEHAGLIDKAKQYRDIAEKSRPEIKEVRPMMDKGQRVSVAIYKDGTSEVMPYSPEAEMHFADLGNKVVPMDKNTGLPAGPGMNKSVTPDALLSSSTTRRGQDMTDARQRQGLDLQREAQRTQIIDNPQMGPMLVDKGTGQARPVEGPRGPVPGESQIKQQRGATDVLSLIGEARKSLKGATGSLVGAGVDKVVGAFGGSTPGAMEISKLKAIEGALLSKMPRMEGPQSDRDVQMYQAAAGHVGDPTIPVRLKEAALDQLEAIQAKYAGSTPAQPGAPRRYNPATGRIE